MPRGQVNTMSECAARILKWTKIKWSLWKFAAPTICNGSFSLICYAIGWHLSSKTSALPLARAGAAATAIAIAFTLYDYREALRASKGVASQRFAKVTQKLPLTGATSQKKFEDKLEEKTSLAVRSISIMQAVILIFATLVWGFGDLASSWMVTCH